MPDPKLDPKLDPVSDFVPEPRCPIESLIAGLLPWPASEAGLHVRRRRMIAHRRERAIDLGPGLRLQFEDALTVRHQVQEVLRAERIADMQALRREAATYAHLLPDGASLKATLLIELPDAGERARLLPRLSRAAHRIYLEGGGARVVANANEDLPAGANARHLERPSGVHFLRFALDPPFCAALHGGFGVTLGCDDDACPWRRPLPPMLLARLRAGLAPARSDTLQVRTGRHRAHPAAPAPTDPPARSSHAERTFQ